MSKGMSNRRVKKETANFLDTKQKTINLLLKNRGQLGTFQDVLFRHKQKYSDDTHHQKVMNDFQSFYRFNDNIYSESGQSGNDDRPSFRELEMAAFERTGVGRYMTYILSGKCLRNGFDFYDWDGNYVKKKAVQRSLFTSKFSTEQIHWVAYELIYGISWLVKYWSSHDKFDKAPPSNRPPLAYKAFPPTIMSPANITDTTMMWEDHEKWEFYGGKYNSFRIHPDRVEVLCTRPNPNSWIGFSIFEPIYLSYAAYMNLIVNGIKMVAKYGNVVVAFKMAYPNPSRQMYLEYKELVDSMKASMTFILGSNEEIEFLDTKIGQGLYEFGEFLKEDMMAGTGLSLNQTFGRAEGGGLQGAGALISKQDELETMSNYQADLADNYWSMLNKYWNLDDVFVKFRLEQQKTDMARYEEELLQWQIQALKGQVESIKLNNLLTAMQAQFAMEHPEAMIPDQSGGAPTNSIGTPGNGGAKKLEDKSSPQASTLSMDKIKKANQDFINVNFNILNHFKPKIIDAEFRKK